MAHVSHEHSLLAQLRAQRWGYQHANQEAANELAERQAALLVHLTRSHDGVDLERIIRSLPRLTVTTANIPTSGLSVWDGQQWIITLNHQESANRQRFTLLHEYKHIIDHPNVAWLYRDRPNHSAKRAAEAAADHFAGCALMPQHQLLLAWDHGVRDVSDLARYFAVSSRAISGRLTQLGLAPAAESAPDPDFDDPDPLDPATSPEGLAA